MSAAHETSSRGIDTDVAVLRTLEPDRAFERMYRRHASDVYRYALAIVRNAGDAEDVTQTTFLNAFRALQRGERPQKAKSWLLAIAHNVCLQRFRNASRRPQQVAFDENLAEAAVPDESPSADDLVRALQELSFNQRSALVMRELEGRSYAEIGEIMGLQVSAVETLLFRARRALREQLETSITCHEAEELLSRQLDGRLPRGERGALRAHLRACEDCAHVARSQRAQRSAWKALALIPLPGSLSSLFSGGGATVATGVATKIAVVGAAAVLVSGGTYEGVRAVQSRVDKEPAKTAAASAAAPSSRPVVVRANPSPPGKALGQKKQHGKVAEAKAKLVRQGPRAFASRGRRSATSASHGNGQAKVQSEKKRAKNKAAGQKAGAAHGKANGRSSAKSGAGPADTSHPGSGHKR